MEENTLCNIYAAGFTHFCKITLCTSAVVVSKVDILFLVEGSWQYIDLSRDKGGRK